MKAKNVSKGPKFISTHLLINWTCPKCDKENQIELIEEEDLNLSQDNKDKCSKCNTVVTITADQIYNTNRFE